MAHEPSDQFGRIQTDSMRVYPIDVERRRAFRAPRGRRGGVPILRALTAWLLRNGCER